MGPWEPSGDGFASTSSNSLPEIVRTRRFRHVQCIAPRLAMTGDPLFFRAERHVRPHLRIHGSIERLWPPEGGHCRSSGDPRSGGSPRGDGSAALPRRPADAEGDGHRARSTPIRWRPSGRSGKGNNTVVATPTASGKTLVYNIPVFERYLENPSAKALYLFPIEGAGARSGGRHREHGTPPRFPHAPVGRRL